MDFLIVSANKLKVVLSFDELREYGIAEPELDYSAPSVRASFWRILDEAKAHCAFSVSGEKILIQLYPSSSGGELFITKLGALSKSAERTISSSGRVAMLTSELKLYKFKDVATAAAAVRAVSHLLPVKTEALATELGEVCLIFEARSAVGLSVLSEFGSELPASIEHYVRERTAPIPLPH